MKDPDVDIFEKIASLDKHSGPKLSHDGTKVLYLVQPAYKAGEHDTAAVWTAEVDKADSAMQLTSGLFNDHDAVFHPDGESIIFLSDRHKAGGAAQLYKISLSGGEAFPLTKTENKSGVNAFKVSPDGRYIAFASAEEPTAEHERKEKEKDDARVSGDKKDNAKLRLYTFSARDVRNVDVQNDQHVDSVTWSPDSKELLVLLKALSPLEFNESSSSLLRVPVAKGAGPPTAVGTYPRMPSALVWPSMNRLASLEGFVPDQISSASSLYFHELDSFAQSQRFYGENDTVEWLLDLHDDGPVAVGIATGVETRIDIIDNSGKASTIFQTKEEAISSWDVKVLPNGDHVIAAIRSSAVRNEPWNLWTGKGRGSAVALETKVSSHLKWLEERPKLKSEVIRWESADGVEVEGIVTYAKPEGSESPTRLPTILNAHGGECPSWPYSRDVQSFSASWRELLAWNGYLVLNPNYRGSSGRGYDFARAAHAGMGTLEWDDCRKMIDEVVKSGLADPTRLGIGGWSQGGFMTAWGVTATKNLFKAGVMGAGVADWGAMAAESDMPDFEADLGGSGPWTPGDRPDLRGSPIKEVRGVETAVLILHGEKDERVPATQGIMFYRGLKRMSKYPERAQLVIYPREPHAFREKKHGEDVLRRMLEHFDAWVK